MEEERIFTRLALISTVLIGLGTVWMFINPQLISSYWTPNENESKALFALAATAIIALLFSILFAILGATGFLKSKAKVIAILMFIAGLVLYIIHIALFTILRLTSEYGYW